ncbi:MAG: hypothetical protein ACLFS4_04895 [Opitutales bacterium]
MKPATKSILRSVPALLFIACAAMGASEINLSGRKDAVLPVERRDAVHEVARNYLNKEKPQYDTDPEELDNPFVFRGEEPEVEEPASSEPEEPEPVTYNDASVLRLVAAKFVDQITGSLSRGSERFLQLENGRLLRAGSRLSVRLPEMDGREFDLIISEIREDGCTLRLGDATRSISFQDSKSAESGSVEFSEQPE